MAKDHHAEGQQDQAESRDRSGFADHAFDQIFGGHYNPPSNTDDKGQYDAGWNNASNNSPKK